ncbi:hypothetical protein WJX72_006651 [[Myrmecia] bisecta]|uniref:Uncharacterized protein n=1 Tax=[Myrmecia] bisecta TaxID=41462 RepID=A0AAW1QRA8_9CHLO
MALPGCDAKPLMLEELERLWQAEEATQQDLHRPVFWWFWAQDKIWVTNNTEYVIKVRVKTLSANRVQKVVLAAGAAGAKGRAEFERLLAREVPENVQETTMGKGEAERKFLLAAAVGNQAAVSVKAVIDGVEKDLETLLVSQGYLYTVDQPPPGTF